tara:strand:- start:614 stop:841 length:228 start_codon:yes stop_codon:yes gene_type:complete
MSIVRVRPGVAAVIHDASTASMVALTAGAEYDSADPIVKAHGWAFQTDATEDARPRVRSVSIEQATAAPGEKRGK